jgi:type VI secretion system secreted protein VgrG
MEKFARMRMKQAARLLNLKTPLGDDELVLTSFAGEEGVSQLFRFELSMLSDNPGIAAKDIVGKNVTFSIRLADDSLRPFNGFVRRFFAGDEDEDGRRAYRAEVVPWLWFLTQNSDCRIFQKKTVPAILQQVFKDRGFSDFQLKLSGHHPKREYCVQHQETDFNFVSRLMEEEGIFYFFQHEDGKHQMILGDKAAAYVDCAQKEVDYPVDFGSLAVEDHIRSWEHGYEFRTGKFAQVDYNFETPSTNLGTSAETIVSVPGNTKFELFEYPGTYASKDDGQPLADVRIEEVEAGCDVVRGSGYVRAMTPGGKFKVREHRSATERGKSFVVIQVKHDAQELMAYETGAGADFGYENTFVCIPASATYRPPRTTRKPRVEGVQTAIVVGPGGEEIYPDKYGRVKVQFHWDRYGKKDENSSCWVRVSQVHAGKGFGGIDIPRIGDEVVVAFPNGDPDQPIIVGRLYHAENTPPFGLPGAKTISGMKTKTYKGDGYNEYVMDDTPGNELIRVHGQYDMDTTVRHDKREHVLNDRHRDVKQNETVWIGGDRTKHIVGKEDITVDKDRTEVVGGSEDVTIEGTRSHLTYLNSHEKVLIAKELSIIAGYNVTVGAIMNEMVGGARINEIGGYRREQVIGWKTEIVGKKKSVSIGSDLTEDVKGDHKSTVGGQCTNTVTNNYTVNAKEITACAQDKITLQTGESSIVLHKDGLIEIVCKTLDVQTKVETSLVSEGKLDMEGANFVLNASSGNGLVSASMIQEVKAQTVKINC